MAGIGTGPDTPGRRAAGTSVPGADDRFVRSWGDPARETSQESAMGHIDTLTGLEVLTPGDCLYLLAGCSVGRAGFVVSGRPHVLPVNYAVDKDASVVFRTTDQSILTNVAGTQVAFEVDGFDERYR